MLARLLEAQPGVFCRIALFTIFDSEVPTPLVDFLNLFLVCHASYQALTYDCASLYFNVFAATFDILGPLSRLGKGAVEEHAEHELKRRFRALKVIRRGYLDDPDLTEAFWITYMMLEEADKGHKNVKQLFATGLYDLLNNFIRQRLYRGSETNSGWPIPNEQNSLARPRSLSSSPSRPSCYCILWARMPDDAGAFDILVRHAIIFRPQGGQSTSNTTSSLSREQE
ncbi:hypothetical protein C0991_008285 [Blastosporella zonata]|nr:hypothetical protein C0991_008285 [Blastosporella zonata]